MCRNQHTDTKQCSIRACWDVENPFACLHQYARVTLNVVSWYSESNWPNYFEGWGQWPPFSIPDESIPGGVFGGNVVILAQICDELSMMCVWGKFGDSSSNLWYWLKKFNTTSDILIVTSFVFRFRRHELPDTNRRTSLMLCQVFWSDYILDLRIKLQQTPHHRHDQLLAPCTGRFEMTPHWP